MTEKNDESGASQEDEKKVPLPDDPAVLKAEIEKLRRENAAHRTKNRDLQAAADRLAKLEDEKKSEGEKLADRIAEAEKRAKEAETRALRLEVATAKGLSAAQAKRLVGETREELEADADEILEAFPTVSGLTPPPSRKPTPQLRGGTDPTTEPVETDPAKLAGSVPRF